jgi:hypothetical protein
MPLLAFMCLGQSWLSKADRHWAHAFIFFWFLMFAKTIMRRKTGIWADEKDDAR